MQSAREISILRPSTTSPRKIDKHRFPIQEFLCCISMSCNLIQKNKKISNTVKIVHQSSCKGNEVLPLDVYIHRDLLCPLFDRLARPSALDSTTVSRSYFEGNQDLTNIARINFNANRITHMFVEYSRHNAHWASRIFHLRTNNTIYSCTFRERLIFQIERKFSLQKKKNQLFFSTKIS